MKRIVSVVILAAFFCLPGFGVTVSAQAGEADWYYQYPDLSVYGISSAAQMFGFSSLVSSGVDFAGKTILLLNNIAFEYIDWDPVGTSANMFAGTFDGGGYSIENIKINTQDNDYIGFFGYTAANAVIKNAAFGGNISAVNAAAIVGYNNGHIENVRNEITVYATGRTAGITVFNKGTILNCCNMADIGNGSNGAGGICAVNDGGVIENTINRGDILGNFYGQTQLAGYIGGIAGKNNGEIIASINTGNVIGGLYTGGIAGYNTYRIAECKNGGRVSASDNNAGGISGCNSGEISDCLNYADVYGLGNVVGGITGENKGAVQKTQNSGAVSGIRNIGGIAGTNIAVIENSVNKGAITSVSDYCGGITAKSTDSGNKIADCLNSGAVFGGAEFTGGICSYAYDTSITDCKNEGKVTGQSSLAGGIVGQIDVVGNSQILRCINTADISGAKSGSGNFAGGLIAQNYSGLLKDSFSSGTVQGNFNVGGLVGYNRGEIQSCAHAGKPNKVVENNDNGTLNASHNINSSSATAAEFKSGKTAWLLNTLDGTQENRGVWTQGGDFPLPAQEAHTPTYKVIFSAEGINDIEVYTDKNGIAEFPAVTFENNIYWLYEDEEFTADTKVSADMVLPGETASSPRTGADAFKQKHARAIALSEVTQTGDDIERVIAALSAYDLLNEIEKTALIDTYEHLTMLFEQFESLAFVRTGAEFENAVANANISRIFLVDDISFERVCGIDRSVIIDGNFHSVTGEGISVTGSGSVKISNISFCDGATGISSDIDNLILDGFIGLNQQGAQGIFIDSGNVLLEGAVLCPTLLADDIPVVMANGGAVIDGGLDCYFTQASGSYIGYYIKNQADTIDVGPIDLIVPAADNDGVFYDTYPVYSGLNCYLMLPSVADLTNITFISVDKAGNEQNRYTYDFSNENTCTVMLKGLEFTVCAKQSKLPTMNIFIDEEYGTIEALNTSPDHSQFAFGDMRLDTPSDVALEKGWQTSYISKEGDDASPGTMQMRGRGNSTWSIAPNTKKPYQIKTEKRIDLLGMGSAKTWILLKNDEYLVKNKLGLDVGRDMGIKYTSEGEFIDLFMNGNYLGNYLLCEKVHIDRERVNITELEKLVEEDGYENVADKTGGYLLEIDNFGGDIINIKTNNIIVSVKSPENLAPVATASNEYAYIYNLVSNFFDAVFSDSGLMPDNRSYLEYIDIESFVRYCIHQEFLANGDFGRGSNFMYKDVDSIDPLIHCGPVWDSDMILSAAEGWYGKDLFMQGGNHPTFFNALMNRKDFISYLLWYYENTDISQKMTEAAGHIAMYEQELRESAEMNRIRWNLKKVNMSDLSAVLNTRAAWIDSNYLSLMDEAEKGSEIIVTAPEENDETKIAAFDFTNSSQGMVFDGDYNTGYAATGGTSNAVLTASINGNDKRVLEWATEKYSTEHGSDYVPVIAANSSNQWGEAYFEVQLCAAGCSDIVFSAKLGGTKKGPKNYKLQYSLDGLTYTDIQGSEYSLSTNKDMQQAFNKIPIPQEANDVETLYIRIVSVGDESIGGNLLSSAPSSGEAAINNIEICAMVSGEIPLAVPVASIATGSGLFTDDVVNVSCVDEEAQIYYTLSADDIVISQGLHTPIAPFELTGADSVLFTVWSQKDGKESERVIYEYINAGDLITKFASGEKTVLNEKIHSPLGYYPGLLSASADGEQVFIPLIDAKGFAISPDDGLKWNSGGGWVMEFCTAGYKDLSLSMTAASTKKGPASMSIAYSLDGVNYTDIIKDKAFPVTTPDTYYDMFALPSQMENCSKVYLKLYMEQNKRADVSDTAALFNNASSGNTYIENVTLSGKAIEETAFMPYTKKTGNRYAEHERLEFVSPKNQPLYYSIYKGKQPICEYLPYDGGIDLNAAAKGQSCTLYVWAYGGEHDDELAEEKLSIPFTREYIPKGEIITQYRYNDASLVSDTQALASTGDGTLYMYPNGEIAAMLSYDKKYGIKVSATADNTWTSSTDGNNDGYWLFTTNTLGYRNLSLSAYQNASNKGPARYRLEYSLDGKSYFKVQEGKSAVENTLAYSYFDFNLPDTLANKPLVYFKLCIDTGENYAGYELTDSTESVGKGHTGINDITVSGVPVGEIETFLNPEGETFYFGIENKTAESLNAEIICAAYRDGLLVKCVLTPYATIFTGGLHDGIMDVSGLVYDDIRVFAWDGTGSMRPICTTR